MGSVGTHDGYDDTGELLQAQSHVWSQVFGFIASASLKCAIQLGIPDVIHAHGSPMSVLELARDLRVPIEKSHGLFRLMRILAHSGLFETVRSDENGEPAYALNPSSRLLLKDNPFSMSPLVMAVLDPVITSPSHYIGTWFLNDRATPFGMAFGVEFWENMGQNSSWRDLFNEGMASDTRFMSSILVDGPGKDVFEGVDSLVDVGGGTGTFARAIADAFPRMNCTVLDLPNVVRGLEGGKNLDFVEGDMFEKVPPADTVLLKWILHDWSDEESLKILSRCRESISHSKNKGKVIIIDIVVGDEDGNGNARADDKDVGSQLSFDLLVMYLILGKERTEVEWAKLFREAGFSGYKISPLKLGLRSLIEVYL